MPMEASVRRARTNMARNFIDSCTITHDPAGHEDETLDPVTLQLVPAPGGGPTEVYDGPCLIGQQAMMYVEEGGRPVRIERVRAIVPFDAPVPANGDTFTLTTSALNPALEGLSYEITDVGGDTSTLVFRDLTLERHTPSPAAP